MTRRMWTWCAALGVLGLVDLAVSVRSRADWSHTGTDAQASLTLGQLLGFITSAVLLLLALTVLASGWRARRDRARYERLRRFDGETGPDISTY